MNVIFLKDSTSAIMASSDPQKQFSLRLRHIQAIYEDLAQMAALGLIKINLIGLCVI